MRKLIFKLTLLLFSAFLVTSCSEDRMPDWPASEPDASLTRSVESDVRSLDEALEYADSFFSQYSGDKTRASRSVESIEYITSGDRTRSGAADTLFYLVNYSSNQGFALLGRPAESYDIYAISTEGRLKMSDTIQNKGLAEFFTLATEHAVAASSIVVAPWDSVSIRWYYNITRKVEPMLHKNLTVWNQSHPFNQYCPMVNGKRGVAGCGPVAVATLMAHYRWPERMGNSYYNWDAIVEGNDYLKISRLIEDLAAPEYLNAVYPEMQDGVMGALRVIFPRTVVNRTFMKWGYDTSISYNYSVFKTVKDDLFSFMSKGCLQACAAPVLMYGETSNGGHIWIVDGFIERTKSRTMLDNPFNKPLEVDPLLHMIWGWGGNSNGYFAYIRDSDLLSENPIVGDGVGGQYAGLKVYGRYAK